jgi:hypothetical protein
VAVFGVPSLHEDDALRAVRAAVELRDTVGVDVRVGVNTGEVVAAAAGSPLVSGVAVNVAARIEQAAAPREVLIGEDTYRLVRDAVDVALLPPLDAKGKPEPVTVYRLLDVTGDVPFARRVSRRSSTSSSPSPTGAATRRSCSVPRASGSPRPAARLERRQAERHDCAARAAERGRDRAADRGTARVGDA